MDIEKLISTLLSTTYEFESKTFNGERETLVLPLVANTMESEKTLRTTIHKWFAEQNIEVDMRRLGELEAKCKVYEAVIENSDLAKIFAPILESNATTTEASPCVKRSCYNCRFERISIDELPCSICETNFSSFEPKEEVSNKERICGNH
jgi:hypothetical protein